MKGFPNSSRFIGGLGEAFVEKAAIANDKCLVPVLRSK
jgi:hypothetical protein